MNITIGAQFSYFTVVWDFCDYFSANNKLAKYIA